MTSLLLADAQTGTEAADRQAAMSAALSRLYASYEAALPPAACDRRMREGAWAWLILASIHIVHQAAAETCDFEHLDRLIAGRDDRLALHGQPSRPFTRDALIGWGRFYRDIKPTMLPAWRHVWRDLVVARTAA